MSYAIRNTDLYYLNTWAKEHNVDLNACEEFGNIKSTPLVFAMRDRNRKAFDELLKLGVDINQTCRGNRTALMTASSRPDHYYFKKLLELGADTTIKDHRGKTVLDYLKNSDNYELISLIE